MASIDLNCDMGEAFGNYPMPNDEILMDYITSANIACGFHAGDAAVMQQTVNLAAQKGVAIGAHPGLQDLQGFGRREIKISPAETYQITLYQIGAIAAFAKAAGTKLSHVKPHGALYNMAAKDATLAKALAQAVKDFDDSLIFYGLTNSEMIAQAQALGLKTASEVFADRTYQDDGTLTPRTQPNAMITEEEKSIAQVLRMVQHGEVVSVNGKVVKLKADTLCLHGDGAHAVPFAKKINEHLRQEGLTISRPQL